MTSKNIYLLSTGSYSDYRVMCVCQEEETAKNFKKAYDENCEYEHVEIEEIQLFTKDEEPLKIETHQASIILFSDISVIVPDEGSTKFFLEESINYISWTGWNFEGVTPLTRPVVRCFTVGPDRMKLLIEANTLEAVAKVAKERITLFLSGSWNPFRKEEVDV
jgi:hypothetical protein